MKTFKNLLGLVMVSALVAIGGPELLALMTIPYYGKEWAKVVCK